MAPPLSPHPGSQEGVRHSPGRLHCPRPCCLQCQQPPSTQGVEHLALPHRVRPDAVEETVIFVLQPLSQWMRRQDLDQPGCISSKGISIKCTFGGALTELYSSPLRSMQRNHLLLKSNSRTLSLRMDLTGETAEMKEGEKT